MTVNLSAASIETLEYLHTHGAATAEELHAATRNGRPHQVMRDIVRRLTRLEELHWVYSEVGADGLTRWHALGGAPEPAPRARPKPYVGQVVPPRQFDVMRAPPYTGAPAPAARLGALDFQRFASHGVRC